MFIKSVSGSNVGPFCGKFKYEFVNGTVGIFGVNGVGKSTLMNLMYLAITNSYSRFSNKDSVVNDRADGAAKIQIVLSVDNKNVVIDRNITSGKHKLTYEGESVAGADAVDQKLLEITNIPKDVWGSCAFKEQNEIYDFLQLTQSMRSKFFHTICGTGKCEQIWKVLGDTCSRVEKQIDSGTVEADLLLARADYNAERESVTAANKKILSMKAKYEEMKPKAQVASKVLSDDEKHRKAAERKHKLEADKTSLLEEVHRARNEIKILTPKLVSTSSNVAEEVAGYEVLLRERRQYEKAYDNWRHAADRLLDIERRVEELRKVPELQCNPTELNKKVTALRKKVADISSRVNRSEAQLAYTASGGLTECETCGTPVKDMVPESQRKKELVKHKKELEVASAELQKEDDLLSRYNRAFYALETEEKQLLSRRKAMGEQPVASILEDVDTIQTKLDEARARLREFERIEEDLDYAQRRYDSKSAELKKVNAGLKELHDVPSPDAAEVRASINIMQEYSSLRATLRAELAVINSPEAKRRLATTKQRVESLETRLAASAKARQVLEKLERLRRLFHRDSLPAKLAVENLARLCGPVNAQLNNFGHPFTLEPSDDLEFIVRDNYGNVCPASRLSIGQQVVLAVAFWTALGDMWQDGLGVLVLDEPTANLDEDNKSHLANMLESLTQKQVNRQLFVVTHEQTLKPYFAQVVTL